MKKVAHIILAHSKPEQLERLILRLQNPESFVFVHLDKKCSMADYSFLLTTTNVEMIAERFDVNWGGFSQVMAIISSIRQAVRHIFHFNHINLISGQDYPIKPTSDFIDFLDLNRGRSFLDFKVPGDPWLEEARGRISKYHLTDQRFRGSIFLERIINFAMPTRPKLNDFVIVGHSTWFTLAWESANYLIGFFETNPTFIKRFNYSWGADELLIHSILFNSDFRSKLINNNLRYIDWTTGGASPKTLTFEDSSSLTESKCFFARKFDSTLDEKILDYLDDEILKYGTKTT